MIEAISAMPLQMPSLSAMTTVTKKTRTPLGTAFCPGEYSVLCGRGKVCSTSSGNRHLKSLVSHFLQPYSEAASKIEKSNIVSAIMTTIRRAAPDGAFVKFEEGQWWEVEDAFAREKIGCMFRDCLHTQYRSSTKAKLARRRKQRKPEPTAEMEQSPPTLISCEPVLSSAQVSLLEGDDFRSPSISIPQCAPKRFPNPLQKVPRQVSYEQQEVVPASLPCTHDLLDPLVDADDVFSSPLGDIALSGDCFEFPETEIGALSNFLEECF